LIGQRIENGVNALWWLGTVHSARSILFAANLWQSGCWLE